ncbi:hypothetical protein EVAR_31348_1 [Eumeta japonica]|uniref:Uncharacterized protein n=1 Tax=Eumeta variegata TaxID=151549 RepID=A0A4C1XCQ0_EUMVA|nr:hypothetical protein EVAR_31348_1 [Eumeta japonica]
MSFDYGYRCCPRNVIYIFVLWRCSLPSDSKQQINLLPCDAVTCGDAARSARPFVNSHDDTSAGSAAAIDEYEYIESCSGRVRVWWLGVQVHCAYEFVH